MPAINGAAPQTFIIENWHQGDFGFEPHNNFGYAPVGVPSTDGTGALTSYPHPESTDPGDIAGPEK